LASVNTAMWFQDSATRLIDPAVTRIAWVPYGQEELLVHGIDLAMATRFCAEWYNSAWYPERGYLSSYSLVLHPLLL
jgi:hypothetical protein